MSRLRTFLLASGALALAAGVLVAQAPSPASSEPSTVVTKTALGATGIAKTKTAVRQMIAADGTTTEVDRRTIGLKVSETTNLRGRQEVDVAWTGAHPTGGLVGDVNSAAGANEEYPFVLLQCRGVDSTSVPLAKRIRPETCWTQTSSERFTSDLNTSYPAWRSDANAPASERARLVNVPDPRPSKCSRAASAERWVPLVGEDGTVYPGGSLGCGGQAPESANVGGTGLPSNATYGITGTDGKGSTQFSVWTEDENATLGCSSSVPCSLVAVPVMGISCDAYGTRLPAADRPDADTGEAADTLCRKPDVFAPGQISTPGNAPNLASAGTLWWAASNWHNRITVPLSFAVSSNVCAVVSKEKPIAIYGSSLLNELTAQWQPKFCTDKSLFSFVHVQTADTSARTLLQAGNIDAAFSSRGPDGGFVRPVVQAPVAVSGFAITYVIDDDDGQRYEKLRLNPRLLAKLLTESYPGNSIVKSSYTALGHNPMNITVDPEFKALNPGLPEYSSKEAAATLLTLSSEADMVYALTSYINADPVARAWLDGKADPWGMVVNPTYKKVDLPVYSWPLLDDFKAPQSYIDGGNNPCYSNSPGPYLALIANPTAFVASIVLNMQYAISNVSLDCPNGDPFDVSTLKLQIQGRQPPGFRFVLGVAPLSAVSRYSLSAAALQSGPAPTSPDDSASRAAATVGDGTFVSGNDAALKAAAGLFKADKAAKTWTVDYDALKSAQGKAAYPGALPVFADVPTKGLTAVDANKLSKLLGYAAGPGQHRGLANGDLPPGYLPLTKANGLAAYADYTARAAAAVKAQNGLVPSLDAADDATAPGKPGGPSTSGPANVPTVPDAATKPDNGTIPPASAAGVTPAVTAPFTTVGQHSVLGSIGLPMILVIAVLFGAVGLALQWGGLLQAAAIAVAGSRSFRLLWGKK